MLSFADKLLKRIHARGNGYAFTAKDFLDIGSRGSADQALSTLAKDGKIRRVCRGIYDYPQFSNLLKRQMAPDFDQVARAAARRLGTRIQPTGAIAANLLGLSEQVPAKMIYLTDGKSRMLRFGTRTITFQRSSPKALLDNERSALVIQAVRFLGKGGLTEEAIGKIRLQLTPAQRRTLLRDARYTSDWLAAAAKRIAQGEPHGQGGSSRP